MSSSRPPGACLTHQVTLSTTAILRIDDASGAVEKAVLGPVKKGGAIPEAAATVFLGNGYVGTSMEKIASLATVSKQTVSKHGAGAAPW